LKPSLGKGNDKDFRLLGGVVIEIYAQIWKLGKALYPTKKRLLPGRK
jgi:hypothetical protein